MVKVHIELTIHLLHHSMYFREKNREITFLPSMSIKIHSHVHGAQHRRALYF